MTSSDPSGQDRARNVEEARELRSYLKAVGDTTRLLILRRLVERGETSVTDLAVELRVSQPLLSWHLGVLRRIGLVSVRRQGRVAMYSVDRDAFVAFRDWFDDWIGIDEEKSQRGKSG